MPKTSNDEIKSLKLNKGRILLYFSKNSFFEAQFVAMKWKIHYAQFSILSVSELSAKGLIHWP